jgi:hypothetical protein
VSETTNPSSNFPSSTKSVQLPLAIRGANDPKVISRGKLIFQKSVIILGLMSLFSIAASFF